MLVLALLALAPSANAHAQSGALTQLPGAAGCASTAGMDGCGFAPQLGVPRTLVVSPDGSDVVVGSGAYADAAQRQLTGAGLTVLRRDPANGVLTPVACANSTGALGCTPVPELGVVYSLAVAPATAPGGARIYALATGPRSGPRLFEFIRDATTGSLVAAARPQKVDVVGNGGTLALGPGGDTLYVGGDRGLRIFQRYSQPALAPLPGRDACITGTGRVARTGPIVCRTARGLGEVLSVAIAPGGAALWVASYREKPSGAFGTSGIVTFARNKPGTLAQRPGKKGCVVDSGGDRTLGPGCTRTRGLRSARSLAAVGDTTVVAQSDTALVSFSRLFAPDLSLRSRARVTGAAFVTPDGRSVYSFPLRPGLPPIAAYARSESGRLTPQAAPAARAMNGASGVAITPDGRTLYVASPQSQAVGVFSRQP
jgi:DNA-binding beta-propeller fold protein YncE